MRRKGSNKVRIAVVEDEPGFLELLRRRLRRMPDVAIVGLHLNAADALDIFPNTKPDLVLMDIVMPGMDGVECTRRVIKILPSVKIVMVTGVDARETLQEALRAGAKGYVTKPVSREELDDAIHSVLKNQAFVSRAMLNDLCQLACGRPPGEIDPRLTARQNEVMELVRRGLSAKQVADVLGVGVSTVKKHLQHIYLKVGAHNRVEAINAVPAPSPN